MKKKVNYIKVNLSTKNKPLNKNNSNGNSYIRVKEKYDSYLERNKNIRLLKENSTLGKITSRDYLEERHSNNKDDNSQNLSLLPFIPQQKINSKKKEELKKLQRNAVSMRRLEYSMKVKDVSTKKRCRNSNKYNIKKVIIIQKWVKGFLLRSFLSNVCECEIIMNDFIKHINKYIFLKLNIFQKLKNNNISIKNINDNISMGKKCSGNINDIISISNNNTNNNTNTYTNNNTFSLCQDTPEIYANENRKLIVGQKRNCNGPSLRELLMANSDKNKNNNNLGNRNNKSKSDIKNSKNIQRAKSLNDIKSINIQQVKRNNANNQSNPSSLKTNLNIIIPNQTRNDKENNKIEIKTTNLRSLLFNNNSNNNNNNNKLVKKYFKKPINNIMYITKISYYINNDIINKSSRSEKLSMPKIYTLSLEDDDNDIINGKERIENGLLALDNIIIEEIKEAKEDEEEDSQSQIDIKKNSNILDINEIIESSRENETDTILSEIQKEEQNNKKNNNKDRIYNISSTSFQINSSNYNKGKIFFLLLLQKQIMFSLKPYIFNLLKQYWINKIAS